VLLVVAAVPTASQDPSTQVVINDERLMPGADGNKKQKQPA
jgi:hypothetical protein